MSWPIEQTYRFGEFTIDPQQKILLRNDRPLPLAPKVFDTLLILVDSGGRLVAKEELMRRLWPDTFVEESNLTFNIQQIRKALGDNARQPRFVETVARRGYRFIAEVNGNSAATAAPETELSRAGISNSPPAKKKAYLAISAIAVMMVVVAALVLWFARVRRATSTSSVPILSTPFKSEKFATGGVIRAAITPDGKYVAYTNESGGKESIWLRQLATSENIQIVPPVNEQYLGLTISHDGNSLYFVRKTRTDRAESAIYRVMTFGGIPVKLVSHTEGTVSLSPDDKQLSFIRCEYHDDDFCSLYIADANGTNERKILTRRRPLRLAGAQISPDGKSIAFASGQSWNGGSDFRLMQLDLAGGNETALTARSFFNILNLKWLPGAEGLLLTASESLDGTFRIWHVSTGTREARSLTKDSVDYNSLSLNQAGDKLIATHISNTFHLYLAKMDDVNNPKNLTAARVGFAFTPDGRIVYEGNDGDIWSINREGGEQRQLTNSPSKDMYPRVSSDGRYIFFMSNRSGSNQVWRINSDGTSQMQITKHEGGGPRFVTPDGKWVYFLSELHQNLWRVSADGDGQETEVLNEMILEPAFSPDGTLVAYLFHPKDNRTRIDLAVMALADGKTLKTITQVNGQSHMVVVTWATDNKALFYVTTDGSQNLVWRQSLDDENPTLVGELGNDEIAHLSSSPDGSSIAFIRGRWIHDAVLIEGLR